MCNTCIVGFHEVKAEACEIVACWAHNPKVGMWNSRSKPPLGNKSFLQLINSL